jgi:hypothetical protein
VDLNPNAGVCEWSKDFGVGAMYFSQQAVNFLACRYGMKFPKTMKLPERLKVVQAAMEKREEIALKIYLMIGRYLANAAAWYREFYDYSNLMILGRVTSGFGGDIILNTARMGLEAVDPMLADMKAKTAAIKPAAEQVSGIMQQLNVTIDAAHMTVLDLDGKLEKLSEITGKVTYILETAPETAKGVAGAIKRALPHKR